MEEANNLHIYFAVPESTTTIETIDLILKNNGLEESDEEFLNKDERGEEPRLIIVRDAARAMVGKKIPEEKMVEFLSKHLETSKETAIKIIAEIKEKLLPYAKVVPVGGSIKVEEEIETIETISESEKPQAPNISVSKPVGVKDPAPEPEASKVKRVLPPEAAKPNPADSYREPIE